MADDKVTSYFQSGGITAHTVNVNNSPRKMSDSLGSQLKEKISKDSKISIVAAMGDGEACSFAKQVLEWLKDDGYSNVLGVIQAIWTTPFKGQVVNKKSEEEYEIRIGHRE